MMGHKTYFNEETWPTIPITFSLLVRWAARLTCFIVNYSFPIEYVIVMLSLTSNNPSALKKAQIVYNFGLSECNRVKLYTQSTLVILTSIISNNRLSRRENLILV